VKTAIINGRLDGTPGIIQHRRISPPDPQVFAGLDLIAKQIAVKSTAAIDDGNREMIEEFPHRAKVQNLPTASATSALWEGAGSLSRPRTDNSKNRLGCPADPVTSAPGRASKT